MDTQKGMSRGTVIVGAVLIAVGILFLIASVLGRDIVGVWWPLFIVVVGLLFFLPLTLQGSGWGAFAIPGSIVTMTGLVLLFQNIFGAWASWAYAWALIAPFGVGVGLYIFGRVSGSQSLCEAGSVVMKIGLILFLGFGFFFEALLNVSGSLATRILWPVLLILVGLWIMLRPAIRTRQVATEQPSTEPQPWVPPAAVQPDVVVPAPTPSASEAVPDTPVPAPEPQPTPEPQAAPEPQPAPDPQPTAEPGPAIAAEPLPKECSACGAIAVEGAAFCSRCGARLAQGDTSLDQA